MNDLLCLGEPLCELNAQANGTFKAGFGGDVSNVAIAAARQGTDVGLIWRVGDDPFGADLGRLCQVSADDIPEAAIAHARIFYSSGIGLGVSKKLRAATFHAASVAKQHGMTVAFDPNLRTAV